MRFTCSWKRCVRQLYASRHCSQGILPNDLTLCHEARNIMQKIKRDFKNLMSNENQTSTGYIFLDGQNERQLLLTQITQVRQEVLGYFKALPEDSLYTPRYYRSWSPAAMLAHLNATDSLSLWLIKLSLLNFTPQISIPMLNRANDTMATMFSKRVMEASMKSVGKNEARIADFITHLPMNKFSKRVYHPAYQQFMTVEQAVQALFLHHWQGHLADMRAEDGK